MTRNPREINKLGARHFVMQLDDHAQGHVYITSFFVFTRLNTVFVCSASHVIADIDVDQNDYFISGD